jgi:hypothetical protein
MELHSTAVQGRLAAEYTGMHRQQRSYAVGQLGSWAVP